MPTPLGRRAARPGGTRAAVGRAPDERRRDAVGPGGHAGNRKPARLADDRRAHARRSSSDLEAFADGCAATALSDVVLLGMGGSSLAPEVLRRCFATAPRPAAPARARHDRRRRRSRAVAASVDRPTRTLFLVSSKSGGTIEPLSLFAHFWSLDGDGRIRRDHRPRLGAERLAARARLPARVRRRPGHRRALQRAVAVRHGARGADRRRRARRCSRARARGSRACGRRRWDGRRRPGRRGRVAGRGAQRARPEPDATS